ncbi:MAG: YbhB/YbcL family Raf kinase inhibitor-like protein [Acidimicrobiales bacterium]
MKLTSPEFADGSPIPTRYTCDGDNVSPPLEWRDLPEGTVALALTCEDPDAPRGTFVHWVLWDLAPTTTRLEVGEVPAGSQEGRNGFGQSGYGGPCPPPGHGTHHYVFSLAALSEAVDVPAGASIDDLRRVTDGSTLEVATLISTYQR